MAATTISGCCGSLPIKPFAREGWAPSAISTLFASGSNSFMPVAWARSIAKKPGGSKLGVTSLYERLAAQLVPLSLLMVEKPWSEVRIMSVFASKPNSFTAAKIDARLLSALRIDASDVGPLMPGTVRPKLSPWLCWVPSGSRDQNTRMNGLFLSLNSGSTALVVASAK